MKLLPVEDNPTMQATRRAAQAPGADHGTAAPLRGPQAEPLSGAVLLDGLPIGTTVDDATGLAKQMLALAEVEQLRQQGDAGAPSTPDP